MDSHTQSSAEIAHTQSYDYNSEPGTYQSQSQPPQTQQRYQDESLHQTQSTPEGRYYSQHTRDRSRSPGREGHPSANSGRSYSDRDGYDQERSYYTQQSEHPSHASRDEPPQPQYDAGSVKAPEPEGQSRTTIYARNLTVETKEEDVKEFFSQFGEVDRCTFLVNHHAGDPRAFIKMKNPESVDAAMAQRGKGLAILDREVEYERARLDGPREKTPGLYKGRYPTRGSRGGGMRYPRDGMYRPREPYGRGPPRDSRYGPPRDYYGRPGSSGGRPGYGRPPPPSWRDGGRSPPRRGSRYPDYPPPPYGGPGRDYGRPYDRGYGGDRMPPSDRGRSYHDGGRPPMGREDGPPGRYYAGRSGPPPGPDPRYERPDGPGYGAPGGYGRH